MTDSVRLVFPFYGDDATRLSHFMAVKRHIRASFQWPDSVVRSSVSPGHARNVGARALNDETILVFNDADTICPPGQIREAVRLAGEAPGLVFAYDLYVRLTEAGTVGHSLGKPIEDCTIDRVIHNSGSMGCVAISRACFEEVGGFDEAYLGWGYEDLDFAERCDRLWPIRRVTGPVYHLWHGERRGDDSPADSDETQVGLNHARWAARG